MKISKGIEHFYNYQRLNVKKKYIQKLSIYPGQFPKSFRRYRAFVHHIRGHSGFHVHLVRWDQTEYEEITIHPPVSIF